jgi:hypothetical protein
MRTRFMPVAAAAFLLCGLMAPSLMAQQAAPSSEGQLALQGGGGQGRGGGGQGRGGGGGRGGAAPQLPPPTNAQGRVLLTSESPEQKGVWLPTIGINSPIAPLETIPFQPWARALYDYRQTHELEPHARCKASGVTRPFQTPYGVEFVELPELQRIYVFDVGGPHTYRTIYMDGRTHPKNLTPSYYGHSIGWWEGDTLVVDSTGFNESFWLDRRGIPHTEALRTLERFTRTAAGTIVYEVVLDDPGVYTAPWTGGFNLRWEADTELFEFICQQANYADELMVGHYEEASFTSWVVP